jgi:DNA-binding transcriptional MerR regulator
VRDGGGPTWKIGELSRLTGLTVRTLHHYDHIGLLRPSARTASGHRLYGERDVALLYRIVALRELGLPLETVGGLLAGDPDLPALLRGHLAHVDQQLTAMRALRTRLATLVHTVAEQPSPADLLGLIEEVSKMEETIKNYFTEEQLGALAARRERLGEDTIERVQDEWPELIAKVRAELDAGTDPAHPRVRALARRWMELLEAFHGGDPGLRDSLYRMQAENSEQIRQQYGGPTPELMEYIKRANAAAE